MADLLTLLSNKQRRGADINSAATITLPAVGDLFVVTGTTNISKIETGGRGQGARVWLLFEGQLTLTHGTDIALDGAANVTTEAGKVLLFIVTNTDAVRQVGIRGKDGSGGAAVEMQVDNGYAQWRLNDGIDTWHDLIKLSDLKGADGTNGTNGANGSNGASINLRINSGEIQWQQDDGQDGWHKLIDVDDLKGADGAAGAKGSDGDDGVGLSFERPASEALSKWHLVSIDDSGTVTIADNDANKPCWGYVDEAVGKNAMASVLMGNIMEGQSGLIPGSLCYLGENGALTQTPPSGSGKILQTVGMALTATTALFMRGEIVEL